MSLKINYLDKKKTLFKEQGYFYSTKLKIEAFKGEFDDNTRVKILKFLKTRQRFKKK